MKNTPKPLSEYTKIGFFGIGCSNLSILGSLPDRTEITLRSDVPISARLAGEVRATRIYECEHAFDEINEEILILSPSVRRDRKELAALSARGVRLTSDAELFFDRVTVPVLGVSGSDGKSTTATLADLILKESDVKSTVTGNVGVPMLSSLESNAEVYVAELSSFMLTGFAPRTARATLTNITENHLDWHRDMTEYVDAKLSLLKNTDEPVVNADDPIISQLAHSAHTVVSTLQSEDTLHSRYGSRKYVTLRDGRIISSNGLSVPPDLIKGFRKHDITNLMHAIALTDGMLTTAGLFRAIDKFERLPHRASTVGVIGGVRYVDSSIDTTPERTRTTLISEDEPVILIIGGRDKGLSLSPILSARDKIRYFIAQGENRAKVYRELSRYVHGDIADTLRDAVTLAASIAKVGDTVLLSPAAASYDAFTDYRERGDIFKEIVNGIKA